MALETLDEVRNIGEFELVCMDDLRKEYPDRFTETGAMDHVWFETTIRPYNFIYLRKDKNSISFTVQNGPIKEVGINGCQVDAIVETAKLIIEGLNKKFPCRENAMAITKLDEALMWLRERTRKRIDRNVEGTSQLQIGDVFFGESLMNGHCIDNYKNSIS